MRVNGLERHIEPRDLPFARLRIEVEHILEGERVDANASRHDDRFRAW